MNKRIKKKWVKALRSGKYKQGHGRLWDGLDHFCCLGVLCDIYAKENNGLWVGRGMDGETGFLPGTVMEWSGIDLDDGGTVNISGNMRALIGHNDSGKTFAKIADAIEEQL